MKSVHGGGQRPRECTEVARGDGRLGTVDVYRGVLQRPPQTSIAAGGELEEGREERGLAHEKVGRDVEEGVLHLLLVSYLHSCSA